MFFLAGAFWSGISRINDTFVTSCNPKTINLKENAGIQSVINTTLENYGYN
jgi:hypothetical protein